MTETIAVEDGPRTLAQESVREQRLAMLDDPHIAPLTEYVHNLRARSLGEIPYFDPLDGGINAQALFLFAKPGPMTTTNPKEARQGSGFVSRNNDDAIAEATYKFMERAKLPRKQTVTWNVVPGWNGSRNIAPPELKTGLDCLGELIKLLPRLRVIMLVGAKAVAAEDYLDPRKFAVLTSDLPSPIVKASRRDRWEAIPIQWSRVREYIRA